jgi:hypothetical protein
MSKQEVKGATKRAASHNWRARKNGRYDLEGMIKHWKKV